MDSPPPRECAGVCAIACAGCEFTFISFVRKNDQELMSFLRDHGVILSEKKCPTCGENCTLSPNQFWMCRRFRSIYKGKKKLKLLADLKKVSVIILFSTPRAKVLWTFATLSHVL